MSNGSLFSPRLHLMHLAYGYPVMHQFHLGWLHDPEVVRFSEQRHVTHTKISVRKYIQSFDHQKDHLFAILLKDQGNLPPEDRYIGNLSIHRDPNNGTANIGIMLGEKKEWRKGYGTEAFNVASGWALANGSRKLEAGFAGPNIGMMKVLEESGYRWEAVVKHHFIIDGKPEDMMLYGRDK